MTGGHRDFLPRRGASLNDVRYQEGIAQKWTVLECILYCNHEQIADKGGYKKVHSRILQSSLMDCPLNSFSLLLSFRVVTAVRQSLRLFHNRVTRSNGGRLLGRRLRHGGGAARGVQALRIHHYASDGGQPDSPTVDSKLAMPGKLLCREKKEK